MGLIGVRSRSIAFAPSVFAHRILLAWDYSFLDDGERANRRSRYGHDESCNGGGCVLRRGSFRDDFPLEAVERVAAHLGGIL